MINIKLIGGAKKSFNSDELKIDESDISINKILELLLKTKPENIIITSGSKQACAFALMAILEPKDEVICINPSYVSYIPQIKIAEPKSKVRILDLDKNFNLDFDLLKKKNK